MFDLCVLCCWHGMYIVVTCPFLYDVILWMQIKTILGYKLHTWGTTQIVAGAKDFSLLQNILTGSGAHTTSFFHGYQGIFPWGLERPKHEADHSLPSSAEVKN